MKVKFVSLDVNDGGGPYEKFTALDDKGRIWQRGWGTKDREKWHMVEAPDEPGKDDGVN